MAKADDTHEGSLTSYNIYIYLRFLFFCSVKFILSSFRILFAYCMNEILFLFVCLDYSYHYLINKNKQKKLFFKQVKNWFSFN